VSFFQQPLCSTLRNTMTLETPTTMADMSVGERDSLSAPTDKPVTALNQHDKLFCDNDKAAAIDEEKDDEFVKSDQKSDSAKVAEADDSPANRVGRYNWIFELLAAIGTGLSGFG
jgi:hypothetical protein